VKLEQDGEWSLALVRQNDIVGCHFADGLAEHLNAGYAHCSLPAIGLVRFFHYVQTIIIVAHNRFRRDESAFLGDAA
jgi:hypothetical protein